MNQNPEQIARDRIDQKLRQSGWLIQDKKTKDFTKALGIALKEYQTAVGPADYVLFVDKKPVGVIEAKRDEEGHRLTMVEEQSKEYADAKLKFLNNAPLNFVYESTGILTHFTDYRDPKPRSREVFSFHRPETFQKWLKEAKTLRGGIHDLPTLPEDGLRNCQIRAINQLEKSFKAQKPSKSLWLLCPMMTIESLRNSMACIVLSFLILLSLMNVTAVFTIFGNKFWIISMVF